MDAADGLWVPYSRRRPRVHQPRIGVTAWENLFRLMVLHMTGLRPGAEMLPARLY